MYHQPHFQELQAAYFPQQQQQQQFVVDDTPPQPSWAGNSPTPSLAGGQLMLQADARATFSSIANWAQEVCFLSEKVEKTGLMSALDYRRLQFLGYTILHHVGLAGAAASATQTTPTAALLATSPPLVEVPVKQEKKRKDRSSSSPSGIVKSSTQCSESPKKRRKHDSTTTETLVAEEQQACVAQPEGPVKTCAECGNWKTHQWRSGPLGMSTLCNACGMRYSRRQKKEAGGEVVATPKPTVVVVPLKPVAKGSRQSSSSKKIRRPRSPQCGHESDHSLSPVSSPLPGTPQLQQLPSFLLKQQLQQQPFDTRSCSVLAALASPAAAHEKRSNLYTLLN